MDFEGFVIPNSAFDEVVRVETRKRKRIPTFTRKPAPKAAMVAAQKIWTDTFSGIEVRSLDSTYNCVGLVFASRRGCVDIVEVMAILADDGYYEIDRRSTVPGDLVTYYESPDKQNMTHVGVIVAKNPHVEKADWDIRVLSQWGFDGEYLHAEHDVPKAYGDVRSYWSERKT